MGISQTLKMLEIFEITGKTKHNIVKTCSFNNQRIICTPTRQDLRVWEGNNGLSLISL